jgi:hypothetical protein
MKRKLIALVLLASTYAGVAFAEPTLGHIDHPLVASQPQVAAAPRAPEQFVPTRAISSDAQERLFNLNP